MVATWMNPDGLYKKFGPLKTVPNTGGEYRTVGELREIELLVNLAGLAATPTILNDEVFYPTSMKLQEVEVFVETVGVPGTVASWSLGLIQTDRTTVIANNYFLNAVVVADQTPAGKKTVYSAAGAGNLGVGQATPNTVPGYITLTTTANTYTSGVLKIRIRYYRPNTN